MQPFYILSLDGGGLRGIFEAKLLQLIQENCELPEFGLVAGTSTGSILGSAFALNVDLNHMLALYLGAEDTIFKKRFFIGPRILERAIKSPYDNLRLRAALRQVFGRRHILNVTMPLVIPTTNLEHSDAFVFTSYDEEMKNTLLYDAIMASCCAPTYFDPFKFNGRLLADGGLHSNNPSVIAISEAVKALKVPLENIKVMSIGTGHFLHCYDHNIESWGIINGWKGNILVEFITTLNGEAINQCAERLLPDGNLLRLNFKSDDLIAPDDFAQTNHLLNLAIECFEQRKDEIQSFFRE